MKKMKAFMHSGSRSQEISELETENRRIAEYTAAESMVLLKNESILPLKPQQKIALFGSGARHMIKGGTGSGDVNVRRQVTIYEGLVNAGFSITTEDWLDDYDTIYQNARLAWRDKILGDVTGDMNWMFFENYSKSPFFFPDGRPIERSECETADVAVYVISRVAGENADRKCAKGDYYLSDGESRDLACLEEWKIPVILLINTGGAIELAEVAAYESVKAILFISQPGQEGGTAAASILSGAVTPSGRLASTWAMHYEDYPNAETFSYQSGDITKEYYKEGIYVGYRYFDSFDIKPLFAFGFGLSYTAFAIEHVQLQADASQVSITGEVRNTGDTYAGKNSVLAFLSCPQGRLPKEYRRMAGFTKTQTLLPGSKESFTISIPAKCLASFDEEQSAWIIEKGTYGVWLGGSIEEAELVGKITVDEEKVLETVSHICPLQETLEELTRPDDVLRKETAWQKLASEKNLPTCTFSPESPKHQVYQADTTNQEAERLAGEIPAKELIPLLLGEINRGQGALGAAGTQVPGAAGETSGAFRKYGIASAVMADGPAGLRLTKSYAIDPKTEELYSDGILASLENGFFATPTEHPGADYYYQYCTAFPTGNLLAQSFDRLLLEDVGYAVQKEMEFFHVSWWLAPGMNIHRNPLCGRNFEYFSEDPIVSGLTAASITKGVQKGCGVGTTIKHFACNNQEDNRIGSDSILSERALREIYLRGFEIAVKESQPMCIMTSYNLVNGVHTANSYDLCTKTAREEWGFQGIIMSDWTTTLPESGSIPHLCIKAGNDLIMPGMDIDLSDITEALDEGKLSEQEIRDCAKRLFGIILRTNAYEDAAPYGAISC